LAADARTFWEHVAAALAARRGVSAREVEVIAEPLGPGSLARWLVVGFLTEPESEALETLAQRGGGRAEIDRVLRVELPLPFSQNDWSWEALTDLEGTVPEGALRAAGVGGSSESDVTPAPSASAPPASPGGAATPEDPADLASQPSVVPISAGGWSWDEGTDPSISSIILSQASLAMRASRTARFALGETFARTRFFELRAARDQLLGRDVVAHVLRADAPITHRHFLEMARLQAAVQHPNIEPVYELSRTPDGRPLLAKSRSLPHTLAGAIKAVAQDEGDARARYPLVRLFEVLLDVARAVAFTHRSGVVHRDLRPSNVRLGELGEVQITGWVRARPRSAPPDEESDALLNAVNDGLGYLAPERLERGLSACGPAADVWGLGAMLYGVLTWRPPVGGRSSSELLVELAAGRIVPPSERRPAGLDALPAMDEVCMRALELDPVRRRISAEEIALRLESFLEGTRAEERQLERAEERVEDAERLSRGYEAARQKMVQATLQAARLRWRSGGRPVDPGTPQAARGLVAKCAQDLELAFIRADEAWARALAESSRLESARRGVCALYFDALQDVERGLVRLPPGYLRAGIREADPGGFADALDAPATLEIKTQPAGLSVRLHALAEQQGQLVPEAGRQMGQTPVRLEGLSAGSWLIVLTGVDPAIRLPVFLRAGELLSLEIPVPTSVPKGCVYVPPGPFEVGEGEDDGLLREALPRGRVHLHGFLIARDPVTFSEWAEFLNALNDSNPASAQSRAPRRFPGAPPFWLPVDGRYRLPFVDPEGHTWFGEWPVVGVQADDTQLFCDWKARRDRLPWRLPTEFEWEKAGRGTDGRAFPWGSRAEQSFAHHRMVNLERPFLVPVGTVPQDVSPYGVRDLAGGVRELTQSFFPGERRVLRGGSWRLPFGECRLTARTPLTLATPLDAIGFRLAMDAPGLPTPAARVPNYSMMPAREAPAPGDAADGLEGAVEVLQSVELTVDGRSIFQRQVGHAHSGHTRRGPEATDLVALADMGPERYAIQEEIARGSMGRVMLAFDRVLERQVALKVLHDKHRDDKLSRYRFVMEARITGRLQHTSIMPIYDIGVLPTGERFFAMKPVEGVSLGDVLKQRSAGEARAREEYGRDRLLTVFRRVCFGVAFAHAHGVVHRDLKPANVLIGDYGEVALVDLGLARLITPDPTDRRDVPEAAELAQADGRVTRVGSVIGTPYYMSPEQAMGLQDMVGPQSDVYGLGAILFHILAGRPPFAGKKVNEVLAKVRRGNPRPPSEVAPEEDIPPELDTLCLRNLAMDPNDRSPDAVEFARDIERFQDSMRDRERERVLQEARMLRANDALTRYDDAWATYLQHASARRRYEAEVQMDDLVARKVPLWQAQERERLLLDDVEARLTEAVRHCRLAISNESPQVRDRLAELLMTHARRAEAMRDEAGAAWCARLLARVDEDGLYGAWLRAGAALSFRTQPVGLMVGIFRCREVERRLVPDEVVHRGPAPVELATLPLGSYVALVNRAGVTLRVPFLVERDSPVELTLVWPNAALLRSGFAFVAGGEFLTGGDTDLAEPLKLIALPSFSIAMHPVTCLEYHEFLADLDVRDRKASERRQPRIVDGGPLVWGPDGERLIGRFSPHRPVTGVTLEDARAFCDWRAARDGVRYRLPSTLEWEKALRGVDGRRFPWGHRFEPAWCRDDHDVLHEVGHFSEDVSPWGVHDLATGVMEWTSTPVEPGAEQMIVRGQSAAAPLHLAPGTASLVRHRGARSPFVGFRLVID